jgi:hypothetical protein
MRLRFLVSWILGLFSKPKEEITFEQAECAPWPFPAPVKKKRGRPPVKKPATKKPAVKKPAVKKTVKKKAK